SPAAARAHAAAFVPAGAAPGSALRRSRGQGAARGCALTVRADRARAGARAVRGVRARSAALRAVRGGAVRAAERTRGATLELRPERVQRRAVPGGRAAARALGRGPVDRAHPLCTRLRGREECAALAADPGRACRELRARRTR